MAIQEHYLQEDYGQVTDNLDELHKSVMNVLKGATTGDFELMIDSQIQIERSRKILKELNQNKIYRDQNDHLYARAGWLRK